MHHDATPAGSWPNISASWTGAASAAAWYSCSDRGSPAPPRTDSIPRRAARTAGRVDARDAAARRRRGSATRRCAGRDRTACSRPGRPRRPGSDRPPSVRPGDLDTLGRRCRRVRAPRPYPRRQQAEPEIGQRLAGTGSTACPGSQPKGRSSPRAAAGAARDQSLPARPGSASIPMTSQTTISGPSSVSTPKSNGRTAAFTAVCGSRRWWRGWPAGPHPARRWCDPASRTWPPWRAGHR